MHRFSQEALAQQLREAASLVSVGDVYAHYKHPEQSYKVVSLVVIEATEEVAVVYATEQGESVSFVRPLTSWCEMVEWEGKTVPRFQKVSSCG